MCGRRRAGGEIVDVRIYCDEKIFGAMFNAIYWLGAVFEFAAFV